MVFRALRLSILYRVNIAKDKFKHQRVVICQLFLIESIVCLYLS